MVAVRDIADWMERVRPLAAINTAEDGHPLIIYDEMMDEFRSTTMRVHHKMYSKAPTNIY